MVTGGVVALWLLWNYYVVAPWTRDGRVRAEVVRIAPEVSGTVAELRVADNQYVKKGDPLFTIDKERFLLALALAEAAVEQRRAEQRVPDSMAIETRKALLRQAEAERDIARLNVERCVVRAPVNGYITNLTLRAGDFVSAGTPQISVVDADSFYVVGYFEETKLPRIAIGARVRVHLMQGGTPLTGRVQGISRGISDTNATPDREGLASVNPVFTWVRLAQRIPVRVALDAVPGSVHIASGLTCSVTVEEGAAVPDTAKSGKPLKEKE
ncbi:HlyD family secretion protein [Verrucomicrobia bacterium LW23]|nr:HlyD family secretion protein [Verrucomicrobia bacterium LW23]